MKAEAGAGCGEARRRGRGRGEGARARRRRRPRARGRLARLPRHAHLPGEGKGRARGRRRDRAASGPNLELLRQQNPKLAKDKPWAHRVGAPEKGMPPSSPPPTSSWANSTSTRRSSCFWSTTRRDHGRHPEQTHPVQHGVRSPGSRTGPLRKTPSTLAETSATAPSPSCTAAIRFRVAWRCCPGCTSAGTTARASW